jgi:tetratricopeptide (TPR) repeat protein
MHLDPENALALYMLAGIGTGSNYKSQLEREQLCRRVIQLRPDWDGPHALLAGLASPWNPSRRIAEMEQALRLAPDDPVYRGSLESTRVARDHLEAELHAHEEKAKADPRNWAIQAAYSARFLCDLKKAEAYYAEFKKFFPDDPPIFLAETYSGCGQYGKAIELCRQVVSNFESRLNSGLTYDQAIQLPEIKLQFLNLLPELNRLELVRATLMERAGNWQLARVYLERAVQAVPNANVYARLVRAIRKENPNGAYQAQAIIEAALKLDAQFLEHHPDLKPYYKAETKK